jgi:cyclic pyranopterin phosphate synthase
VSAFAHRRAIALRISVTDRCQLRCRYCLPPNGVAKRPRDQILSFEEILRFVRALRPEFEVFKVRLTGGEPLLRSGLVELVSMLSAEGIPDLALTTNGQLLAELAGPLQAAGLRRVNVSLDSLDPETYRRLTRGGELAAALRGIAAAVSRGLSPVRLNTVVLRGWNDAEVAELARFALERGLEARFLELMPIGCARPLYEELFVPSAEVRARLSGAFALKPLPAEPGRSSRDFLATDRAGRSGRVGLISSQTAPFCAGCARLRLTSTGRLIACLAEGTGPGVRELLRSAEPDADRRLREAVAGVLDGKRPRRAFRTAQPMCTVGG